MEEELQQQIEQLQQRVKELEQENERLRGSGSQKSSLSMDDAKDLARILLEPAMRQRFQQFTLTGGGSISAGGAWPSYWVGTRGGTA